MSDPRETFERIANLPAGVIGQAIARVWRRGLMVASVALVVALTVSAANAPVFVQGLAWVVAALVAGGVVGWTGGTMFTGVGQAVVPMAVPVVDALGRPPNPWQPPGDCPPCPVCDAPPFQACRDEEGAYLVEGGSVVPHPQRVQVAELAGWRPAAPAAQVCAGWMLQGVEGARNYADQLEALARKVRHSAAAPSSTEEDR